MYRFIDSDICVSLPRHATERAFRIHQETIPMETCTLEQYKRAEQRRMTEIAEQFNGGVTRDDLVDIDGGFSDTEELILMRWMVANA